MLSACVLLTQLVCLACLLLQGNVLLPILFGISCCTKENKNVASAVLHAYRASDDIEGDLGLRLDACMSSAISQCWGGSSMQSVDHARHSKPTRHDNPLDQPRDPDGLVSRTGQHDKACGAPSLTP